IFIIGHWRSGTTLLHELLCLDQRHAWPTTYACMNPSHFLITERGAQRSSAGQASVKRPMDNMTISPASPQEDEFALLALGALSPYAHWMFPANLADHPEYFDLDLATSAGRERWKAIFSKFLRQLTLRDPRRLVIKSPAHTFRVKLLHEMYPEAIFIHIVRDPYVVFASTRHLLIKMFGLYALTRYSGEALDEYILRNGVGMECLLDAAIPGLPSGRYHRVRYEDLIASPTERINEIYRSTGLSGFNDVLPALRNYVERHAGFQGERSELAGNEIENVSCHWRCMFDKYGYPMQASALDAAA
ncbi:MAG: sulfotransferase, partial [Betaproteobacteria bacterium]